MISDGWCSLIADLHHVSAPTLRVAIAAKGADKVDAHHRRDVGDGDNASELRSAGRTIYRRDGRLESADGTLAGSDLDMATAVRNTHAQLGVRPRDRAREWRRLSRRASCGSTRELGRIAPGYRANLVLLDDSLNVTVDLDRRRRRERVASVLRSCLNI